MNNRRRTYNNKKEKILFELYNTYFDGTVNSVIDTGIKLWDGTHNKFKIEIIYTKSTESGNSYITLFACRPDYNAPYSGIRLRKSNDLGTSRDFNFSISENVNLTESDEGFTLISNSYGKHLLYNTILDTNTLTITRNNNILYCNLNGNTAKLTITSPKTNNLNLLIGCDYKGQNNETQRYYKGTITKFVITEL